MDLSIFDEKLNSKLYKALIEGEDDKVVELCKETPGGPLHVVSIHDDTVLHMASYSEKTELALNLLKMLPDIESYKLTIKNDIGNTMLHEAATSNKTSPVVKEMLRRAPELLSMRNEYEETALFRAGRYGRMKMFKFLDDEVHRVFQGEGEEEEEERKAFYQKTDQTTILHAAIIHGHFDLALHMAKTHSHLLSIKDGDGLTALQLLACNPSAFDSGSKQSYLKRLIHSCVRTKDTCTTEEGESCYRVPLWEEVRRQKQSYESAVRLAEFLIARDTSWKNTESAIDQSKSKMHKYGVPSFTSNGQEAGEAQNTMAPETALLLATKKGILEIVEEIVTKYPQAVEHIHDRGHNILHVAIKYRQKHILDFVENLKIPMTRLVRKIDNEGNTILHMVGIKENNYDDKDM